MRQSATKRVVLHFPWRSIEVSGFPDLLKDTLKKKVNTFRHKSYRLSLHTLQIDQREVYFCTITCYKWLPLIEQSQSYRSVYRWFEHLKNDGCKVVGYVIMPNHFHVLLYLTHSGTSINKLVGECKRFMAYDIIAGLKKIGKEEILRKLEGGVAQREKLKGKVHQVFRSSFDARKCMSMDMIEQKLDYIHHNPVRGKWMLVSDFIEYRHSSARFYELGEIGSVAVSHYRELS